MLFLITLTSQLWCRVLDFRHKWKWEFQAFLNHSILMLVWEGSVSTRHHVVLVCPDLTLVIRPNTRRMKVSVKGLRGFGDVPWLFHKFAGLGMFLTLCTRWWPGQVQTGRCHALVHLNRNALMRADPWQQQHWHVDPVGKNCEKFEPSFSLPLKDSILLIDCIMMTNVRPDN